jgi:hypothetical protein
MSNIHMIVGTLVILGYIITLILNARTAATGAEFSWQKIVSFTSATLLLLQYMLGFSLLGEGKDVPAIHFILALGAIIPVGIEHGMGSKKPTAKGRGQIGAMANALTLVVVLITYMIGQNN